jgi:hypothetical protein
MKKTLLLSSAALSLALVNQSSLAQSLIDGVYDSPSGENGRGACQLTISSLGEETKYGDQLFRLESSGEGACEWSAIGMSKNFAITAGSVTSGGVQTFVKLTFPFGPAGKRIQLTSYDADGSVRNEEMFVQNDDTLYAAE